MSRWHVAEFMEYKQSQKKDELVGCFPLLLVSWKGVYRTLSCLLEEASEWS